MIKIIIDDILVSKNTSLLRFLMAVLAGILLLKALLNFLRMYMSGVLGENLVLDLRRKIYDHIPALSLKSITKISPAQILSRMMQDVDSMRRFLFNDAVEFIYAVFSFICVAVIIFCLNAKLAIISLSTLPFFAVLYFRLIPELKNRYGRSREITGLLSARMHEILNGIRVIRAFNRETFEKEKFEEKQDHIVRIASGTHGLNAWLWTGVEFFASLGVMGVLWIGGNDCLNNRLTAGALVAFYTYLGMLFAPVLRMVCVNASFQEASAAMKRINEILKISDGVISHECVVKLSEVRGKIDFKKVNFGYASDGRVLKDISFTVEPGETVGVVGASGVGKTTLISLLLRFFDPDQGGILIDGHDLRTLNLDDYRRQIAVVLQDDFLLSGSIAENIRYGKLEASLDDIIKSAKVACAHDFISSFPNGYETQIGERGMNLSSGQRQRIAIARAIIKNPAVLILDEATSAVDALTENDIQKSIRGHMKGKTVFVVAHRFSTIMEADKIIVLEKGKVVECGKHNYLLKKQGYYSSLYLEQFKKEDNLTLLTT